MMDRPNHNGKIINQSANGHVDESGALVALDCTECNTTLIPGAYEAEFISDGGHYMALDIPGFVCLKCNTLFMLPEVLHKLGLDPDKTIATSAIMSEVDPEKITRWRLMSS